MILIHRLTKFTWENFEQDFFKCLIENSKNPNFTKIFLVTNIQNLILEKVDKVEIMKTSMDEFNLVKYFQNKFKNDTLIYSNPLCVWSNSLNFNLEGKTSFLVKNQAFVFNNDSTVNNINLFDKLFGLEKNSFTIIQNWTTDIRFNSESISFVSKNKKVDYQESKLEDRSTFLQIRTNLVDLYNQILPNKENSNESKKRKSKIKKITKIFTTLNPTNDQNQINAINSWSGFEIYSLNSKKEIKILKDFYKEVNFIENQNVTQSGKKTLPKLDSFLDEMSKMEEPTMFINSDIILKKDTQIEIDENLLKDSIIIGTRYDIDQDRIEKFIQGYDLFIINPLHAKLLKNDKFSIGHPWWDYWLPTIAIINGLNVYEIEDEVFYHQTHSLNYDMEVWKNLGVEFYNQVIKKSNIEISEEEFFCPGQKKLDIKKFIESKSISLTLKQKSKIII